MSTTIVYRLRDEYANEPGVEFEGGLIKVSETEELNIGEALKKGKGEIHADGENNALTIALDAYDPLERVDIRVNTDKDVTVKDLQAQLKERGLATTGSKAELEARLADHDDQAQAEAEAAEADAERAEQAADNINQEA